LVEIVQARRADVAVLLFILRERRSRSVATRLGCEREVVLILLGQDQLSIASIGVGEHYIEFGRGIMNKYSLVTSR
jgi:hypothetical protein